MVWARQTILIWLMLYAVAVAGDLPENHYQWAWCDEQGGVAEYVLPDKTRCDCLTKSHAIEFDFAPKFYQAVGQALYYGLQTGKKAGIVLIIESDTQNKYWLRLNSVIEHYGLPIDTWRITSAE